MWPLSLQAVAVVMVVLADQQNKGQLSTTSAAETAGPPY
jgi:hypothetical protein